MYTNEFLLSERENVTYENLGLQKCVPLLYSLIKKFLPNLNIILFMLLLHCKFAELKAILQIYHTYT